MVCDLSLMDFDPFWVFLYFRFRCFVIVIMIDGGEKRKAAFELQCSFEKRSKSSHCRCCRVCVTFQTEPSATMYLHRLFVF